MAPSGQIEPVLTIDFSQYADTAELLADKGSSGQTFTNEDVIGTGAAIVLDQADGVGSLTQCMKVTLPDRTGDPGLCTNFNVERNFDFPACAPRWSTR